MKYRLKCPDALISLRGLPVSAPSLTSEGNLVMNALMTLTALSRSSLIQENAPLLTEAARTVASNEIRNMGTLGGNLCQETRCLYYNQRHDFQFVEPCLKRGGDSCYFLPKGNKCWAVFMGDTVPALVCLGAEVKIMGSENTRQVTIEDLYSGNPVSPLTIAPNEIIREILIPGAAHKRGAAYAKFSLRGALEFAALGVAAVLDMDDDGETCVQARIAVGAVSGAPLRASKAELSLRGQRLSINLFSKAAQMVIDEVRTVPHHGYSHAYLTEVLKVQSRRVLASAAKRIKGARKEVIASDKEVE
jgi:CO/xanthine dehydrogenase FAD-binding subunit